MRKEIRCSCSYYVSIPMNIRLQVRRPVTSSINFPNWHLSTRTLNYLRSRVMAHRGSLVRSLTSPLRQLYQLSNSSVNHLRFWGRASPWGISWWAARTWPSRCWAGSSGRRCARPPPARGRTSRSSRPTRHWNSRTRSRQILLQESTYWLLGTIEQSFSHWY